MKRSLAELVARWEQVAKRAATYNLTLDDWLNDLDLRDIISREDIDRASADASILRSRLDAADRLFREATSQATGSLWGHVAGAGHDAIRHWWYFRYPRSPGDSMRRDLSAAGILLR